MSARTLLIAAAALMAATGVALAQGDEADQLRGTGLIGEQADGYLGVRTGATVGSDVRARMDSVNIRRRAAYTERAAAQGVTVAEFAAATGCTLLSSRVDPGEWYRGENGQWVQRQPGQAVTLPSYCPR